ncbi:NUDIX hydrolase [Aquibacillus sediminis]|uniref:NUDIX hydrolase n=1 Tax=Aquibacillus sediminis TaxID=2574734 RepID=UPI001109CC13|nr:NUDIX hydrolase [Aquibacillus sediminis]
MSWVELIKNYTVWDEQERKDKAIIINCMETFDDILTRNNEVAHVTSSAFVVNKKRDKVLMVHHNIYNSWSWTGGHADGDEDLLYVAEKEVNEETGVEKISAITDGIISLDILPVKGHEKRGKYVAPHLHLSVAYLFEADENEQLQVKPDENSDVSWIPLEQIEECCANEPHMMHVYKKIITKMNALN